MFPAFTRAVLASSVVALACAPLAAQAKRADVPSIRNVQVLRGGNLVEIQIESTSPVIPQTNELSGPDRLLLDFVNARPGAQLRGVKVGRAEVKELRVGLFSADPPVTRITVDLNSPQPYQVFPAGRTTIVKIGGTEAEIRGSQAPMGNIAAANAAADPPPAPPKPSLEVAFHNGLLSIDSDRASLSQILFAVHQRTGAEIAIPAGSEQDQVVVNLGPAPAPAVLSQLLNGSRFNFVILSSPKNPAVIDQVILSPRADTPTQAQTTAPQPPPPAPDNSAATSDESAAPPRFRMRGRGFPPLRGQGQEPPTEDQEQTPPPPETDNPNPNPQ